jgi:prepilin-type N-terminal cleavage/methylation domain-containing protein
MLKQAGFSLIEVLITVLLIGIAALALNALQSNAIKNNSTAQSRNEALFLAQDKLEKLRQSNLCPRRSPVVGGITVSGSGGNDQAELENITRKATEYRRISLVKDISSPAKAAPDYGCPPITKNPPTAATLPDPQKLYQVERSVQVVVDWKDSFGEKQYISLNSQINWSSLGDLPSPPADACDYAWNASKDLLWGAWAKSGQALYQCTMESGCLASPVTPDTAQGLWKKIGGC